MCVAENMVLLIIKKKQPFLLLIQQIAPEFLMMPSIILEVEALTVNKTQKSLSSWNFQ